VISIIHKQFDFFLGFSYNNNKNNNNKFNVQFTILGQRQGRPEYTRKRQTTPSTQKAQTVTQRRDKHGAIPKIQLPIEERRDQGGKDES